LFTPIAGDSICAATCVGDEKPAAENANRAAGWARGRVFEPIIKPTIDALVGIGAEAIIPAQCTGWRAAHALAQAMPEAYIPNSVGSRLELRCTRSA
jgi:hypothetical protein